MLVEDRHAFVERLEVTHRTSRRARGLSQRLVQARLELLDASRDLQLFDQALQTMTTMPTPPERDLACARKHRERMRRTVAEKSARLETLEEAHRRATRVRDVTYRLHSELHHVNVSEQRFSDLADLQQAMPVQVSSVGGRRWWWYQDRFWWEDEGLSTLAVKTRVVAAGLRRQESLEEVERARTLVLGSGLTAPPPDARIPYAARQEAWLRDAGRCVECGSTATVSLEFIIPLEAGGSSDASNVELRCRPCRELRRENEARASVSRARVGASASYEWRG